MIADPAARVAHGRSPHLIECGAFAMCYGNYFESNRRDDAAPPFRYSAVSGGYAKMSTLAIAETRMTATRAMNAEQMWEAVLRRDASADGSFVYAVQSTMIYCRPTCPSRRPRRENASFFFSIADAERAGYRACLRCRPDGENAQRQAIERACRFVREHIDDSLDLGAIAAAAGVSRFHLIRLFKKTLGVTPLAYARSLRHERLRRGLAKSARVLDAIFDAGFGSASRAYDTAQNQLGMTPGHYRARGEGTMIRYCTIETALGCVLLAATERGVCCVRLGDAREALLAGFREEYSAATLSEDAAALQPWAAQVREYCGGTRTAFDFPLDVAATAFQAKVWEMLRSIPYGETATYTTIANRLGNPKAVRAVARACATNNVALAIPCHRVIREDGSLAGYRWGMERKKSLLGMEHAKADGARR